MKNNWYNEQLGNVTVVFIVLFLQLSVADLYDNWPKKKTEDRMLIAYLLDVMFYLFDLYGK